jgi:hypothetical protein
MAIADDIAIDGSGNIYYTGAVHGAAGAGYYTVIELHRYLQDLADDASASGDDLIDITSSTPSDRSTDNIITIKTGYQLDDANGSATDAISEHLYDGSIIQESDGTIYDGLVVIAAEGMDLQIIQNGAIVANDFWNTVPNGETLKGLNRDVANGISHRFMLLVNNAGTAIDGRRIIGITREMGKTYSEFKVNGTARGNNVLALTYTSDLNNATAKATVATWTTVTNTTEGYASLDIDGNGTPEPYYSEWNKDSYTINQFYERMKWLTECASGSSDGTANGTLYGLNGNLFRGITHEIPLNSGSQSVTDFSAFEPVSWTGGTGQMLAVDDVNAATKMWIQILTGVAPTAGSITITGSTSGATIDTSGASVEKTVSAPFCGASTGSALIGAYGFGMETADTSASDLFLDLNNATNQPPNNVTFTVNGLVSTEDRVLVGPANGTALREDQCQVAASEAITVTTGSVSSATSGAGVVVLSSNTETIGTGQPTATDTPTAGTIRVLDANGIYQIINYTGVTAGSGTLTFSGCTSSGSWTAASTNNAFISYIDKLATATTATYTVVYANTPRSLFIRVRDGGTAGDAEGIKTFETTSTLGAAGGSTTVIRTTDV